MAIVRSGTSQKTEIEQLNDFAYIISMQVKTTLLLVNTVALYSFVSGVRFLFPAVRGELDLFCSDKKEQIREGFKQMGTLTNACFDKTQRPVVLSPEDFTAFKDIGKTKEAMLTTEPLGVNSLYFASRLMQNTVCLVHEVGVDLIVRIAVSAKAEPSWQAFSNCQKCAIRQTLGNLTLLSVDFTKKSFQHFS